MTKKEYNVKKAKLFWLEYIPISIMILLIYTTTYYTVRYFLDFSWVWFGVVLTLYILGLIFLAIIPDLKSARVLDKQGYEKTEKEKLKEIKRHEKWSANFDRKLKRKKERWSRAYNRKNRTAYYNISTMEELRKASLIKIIRWRMEK